MLTFATSILPVFVALLIAERDILDRIWVGIAGIVGGICYLGIVVFLLRAYQRLNWEWRPNRDALHTFALANEESAARVWVADEIRQSLDDNKTVLEKKVAALNLSLILLPVDIIAFAAATIISLFGRH